MTLSPQVRIAALVGVLLIALGGSAFYVLHGRSHPATVTTPTPTPTTHHHPTPTPSTPKPVHVVTPTVDPLFPTPVRKALARYPLVVAGFYNPNSVVTMATLDEARAGAASAHVGFVAVNLLDDSVAGPLTALLPSGQILPNPGFVIYGRPGTLLYRSDGYLDRGAVAEAIKASAPPVSHTSRPTAARFYTSHPDAVLAKIEHQTNQLPGFSDLTCQLYGGNERTGWQHFSCVGTYTHAGTPYRVTVLATPRSCSSVTDLVNVEGRGSFTRTYPWHTHIFTCKAAG